MAKRYWQRCNLKDMEGSTEPERWKHQEQKHSGEGIFLAMGQSDFDS